MAEKIPQEEKKGRIKKNGTGRPAQKGTVDTLLDEVARELSRNAKPKGESQPSNPAPVPAPEISPIAKKLETEEYEAIEARVDERITAEQLKPNERELYLKLPKEKQESYLVHVAETRADEKLRRMKKVEKRKTPRPTPHLADVRLPAAELPAQNPSAEPVVEPKKAKPHIKPKVDKTKPETAQDAAKEAPIPTLEEAVEASERPIIPNPGDAADPEHVQEILGTKEGTRKEWQEKLRALITGAGEKTKETFEWWKSAEEGLIRRSQELDTEAEKIGITEKGFRWLGETYNKLGWKSKLAIGIGLGVGYGAALSAVSLPAIFACIGGIGIQRAAGLATMYLKYEKAGPHGEDRKERGFWTWNWGGSKEKALMKSILYTTAMTAGTVYAAKEISDHDLVHRTQEWLGHMMDKFVGNHPEAGALATAPNVFPHAAPPHNASPFVGQSLPGSAAAAAAGEAAVPAVAAPELPAVDTSAGHGYEWMMKRMWEQLQEKHLDPSQYEANSDMYKLLTADSSSIDKVLHDIAKQHEWYKPDGTSVRIGLDDVMMVDPGSGDIYLGAHTVAPADAPVTPAYHPGVPVSHPETPVIAGAESPFSPYDVTPSVDTSPAALEDQAMNPDYAVPGAESAPAPAEAPASSGETADISSTSSPEIQSLFTSMDHVRINPDVPAIYEARLPNGETYLAAFGGQDEQRFKFIQEYLARPENQGKIIRYSHLMPTINGGVLRVQEIGAEKPEGGILSWILDSFKQQPEPPSPATFLRKVSP